MNNSKKILIGSFLAMVIMVIGCIEINPTPNVPFEDKTWVLETYGKQNNLQPVMEGKETSATFNSSTGKVSGSAGCNSYSAGYQKTNDRLTVTAAISTKMACLTPKGIMQQEMDYLNALQATQTYQVRNNKLEIYCSDNRALIFHAK